MRLLIVGIGALGGTIATRAFRAGVSVRLATRSAASAEALRSSSLRVFGTGGEIVVPDVPVAALAEYAADTFDAIVLATKAQDALEIAPALVRLVASGGALVPIQNGSVSAQLFDQLGDVVLGGLSNLGATMHAPGVFEQRNAGHLLIGELSGGAHDRAQRIVQALSGAIEVRVTPNMRGAIWAKLLLNCSVTTIGAIAGRTMREYRASPEGAEVFRYAYDEALAVALASGAQPEKMIVDPLPPEWRGASVPGAAYDAWIDAIMASYGDLKPSMLQDFERGQRTEIDFINGYVAQLGERMGVPVAMNTAITKLVHRIEQGDARPEPAHLNELWRLVQS